VTQQKVLSLKTTNASTVVIFPIPTDTLKIPFNVFVILHMFGGVTIRFVGATFNSLIAFTALLILHAVHVI
jgi:hypothetical protein